MSAHVSTMHAHSPASYSLSLMIHGAIAVVLVASAYFFNDVRKKSDGIFEVVAGPGDNWAATEAPARGEPDAPGAPAVTVNFTPPADTPRPAPIPETQPAPAQTQTQTPPTTIPRDALVVPPPTTQKQSSKKTDAKQTTAPKQNTSQTMSKADFDRRYAAQNQNMPSNKTPAKTSTSPPGKAVTAKTITATGKGLLDGVVGATGSAPGAGGRALSVAERDQLDAYLAVLAERIKQAQVEPEGLDRTLVARIEYYVGADGTIGAVKIIRSSGNRAFDDSVLKAFRSVRSIGPRPDGQGGAITANFRLKD